MGFTRNSVSVSLSFPSSVRRMRIPESAACCVCSPYGEGQRFPIRVSKYASTSVAYLRFHCSASSPRRTTAPRAPRRASPLLRSSLRLLNVRQVIYTRGFTAREILRKALTRAQKPARRGATPPSSRVPRKARRCRTPSENEKSFFTGRVRATGTTTMSSCR